ncbi:hypothetical protein [Microtetraspora glauca]|uniref:Uncharacterized protein n=1 Tax=Microtetraspora glauca TaxID=1996 RepID=A0ABV3G7B3_MICGL
MGRPAARAAEGSAQPTEATVATTSGRRGVPPRLPHRPGEPARDPSGGSSRPVPEQVAALFGLPAGLREQACWRLIYETTAPVERLLALNVDD